MNMIILVRLLPIAPSLPCKASLYLLFMSSQLKLHHFFPGILHPLFGRLGSRMPFIPHPRFDDPFGFGPPPDQPPGFGQHCDEALGFGQLARSAFGPRRNRVFNLPRMSRF